MAQGNQLEALVVGASIDISWGLPYLLSRAGFAVDVIAIAPPIRFSKFIRTAHIPQSHEEMMQLVCRHAFARTQPYDWIIPVEDETLKALSSLEWPPHLRPRFLPESIEAQTSHIFSKTGLSRVLAEAGIQTPPFRVVSSCKEAVAAARELGYPVMLKTDASFAGLGVREFRTEADLIQHKDLFDAPPVLVQKRIRGQEFAVEAIYIRQELVHFAYSSVLLRTSPLGPSKLRRFFPLPMVGAKVFEELAVLGRVLGADGFVNISCIEAEDGSGRYYFEADMRPNVWVDFSIYLREDSAERIRKGFLTQGCLTKDSIGSLAASSPVVIPYFLRLQCRELLMNRYDVWRFIPLADTRVVVRLVASKIFWRLYCHGCAMLPRGLKNGLRHCIAEVRIRFVPNNPAVERAE